MWELQRMVVTNDTTNSSVFKDAGSLTLLKWAPDWDWDDMHLFFQSIVLEKDNDFVIIIFHHMKCEKKLNTTEYCSITIAFSWRALDLCLLIVNFIAWWIHSAEIKVVEMD